MHNDAQTCTMNELSSCVVSLCISVIYQFIVMESRPRLQAELGNIYIFVETRNMICDNKHPCAHLALRIFG